MDVKRKPKTKEQKHSIKRKLELNSDTINKSKPANFKRQKLDTLVTLEGKVKTSKNLQLSLSDVEKAKRNMLKKKRKKKIKEKRNFRTFWAPTNKKVVKKPRKNDSKTIARIDDTANDKISDATAVDTISSCEPKNSFKNHNEMELKKSKNLQSKLNSKITAKIKRKNDLLGQNKSPKKVKTNLQPDALPRSQKSRLTKTLPQSQKAPVPGEEIREQFIEQLSAARFRYLNQQLYTSSGQDAAELFKEDPDAFETYHKGFEHQVSKWPSNPVDIFIKYIKSRPSAVVADLGCGDAKIAQTVSNKVHSFDLVALNKYVTPCDIRKVPLKKESVDIAVFCLSLMGTNLVEYVIEASRILKNGGVLLIAEVTSRFEKIGKFVRQMKKLGFTAVQQDRSNKMFVWFEFKKESSPPAAVKRPQITLNPCLYKKR